MGYKIDNTSVDTGKYLDPGFYENVTLKEIEKGNTKDDGSGIETLDFVFEKDGKEFTHREFPVTKENSEKFARIIKSTPEQVMKDEMHKLGARVKHILDAFMPTEDYVIAKEDGSDFESWDDFREAVIATAGEHFQGELFKIKLVYNNSDYTSFPPRTFSPFILNMKSDEELKMTKYDRMKPLETDGGKKKDLSSLEKDPDAAQTNQRVF